VFCPEETTRQMYENPVASLPPNDASDSPNDAIDSLVIDAEHPMIISACMERLARLLTRVGWAPPSPMPARSTCHTYAEPEEGGDPGLV
jgi:hypothetical protein